MDNDLQKLLGKQFLITAFIEKKLQVVNYIKDGYDNNLPILINNKFLHSTAHVSYRSIVIDLYALFGKATNNNKNSFFYIEKKFSQWIKPERIILGNNWLSEVQGEIRIIEELRNKQFAHYDFNDKEVISLNFKNLIEINRLFDLSKKIILHYGSSFIDENMTSDYLFEREYHDLVSLKRLVAKASRS